MIASSLSLRLLIVLVLVVPKAFFAFSSAAKPQRTFVITGANGYVGKEIAHALVNDKANKKKIVCLVRPSRVSEETAYWKDRSANVSVMPYDMLDGGKSLQQALETNHHQDECCVLHVASVFGPTENHKQTALENVRGTEDVVKICAQSPNIRLVLTSSMAAIRGTGQTPENGECYTHLDWNTLSELGKNWGNSYQWSKAEAERRAWELSKELGLPMVSLCPAFVFGPSSDGRFASGSYSISLVGEWIRGESKVQSRLCVDVRDVAKAHVKAAILDEVVGNRYIVSTERRLPSQVTANALKEVSPNPEKIIFDDNFDGGTIKIGDREVASTERLEKELGVVLRPVDETFRDMARALLQQEIPNQ